MSRSPFMKQSTAKQSLYSNNQILLVVTSEREGWNNDALFNVRSPLIKDIVVFQENPNCPNHILHSLGKLEFSVR